MLYKTVSITIDDVEKYASQFRIAVPFSHLVIDDFLDLNLARQLLDDFPPIALMHRSHHYLFSNKCELSFWANVSESFQQLYGFLSSDEFKSWISEVCDEELFLDPDFYGELHQAQDGGYLDIHTDFNLHPRQNTWVHRVTMLIYLNKNWRADYGGQLQLQDSSMQTLSEIEPLFNRCVIMRSDNTTYHGYRRLSLPPDVARKSILINFYKQESLAAAPPRRPTTWATNHHSSFKSKLARLYNPIAELKHKIFGLSPAWSRNSLEAIKSHRERSLADENMVPLRNIDE
jgi:2OG-Fe(II) oxygenase superfamily